MLKVLGTGLFQVPRPHEDIGCVMGNIMPHLQRLGSDPVVRVGAYINHIQNLLNS